MYDINCIIKLGLPRGDRVLLALFQLLSSIKWNERPTSAPPIHKIISQNEQLNEFLYVKAGVECSILALAKCRLKANFENDPK
jgi:hypothetical protein